MRNNKQKIRPPRKVMEVKEHLMSLHFSKNTNTWNENAAMKFNYCELSVIHFYTDKRFTS